MRILGYNLITCFYVIALYQSCELFPCEMQILQEIQIDENHLSIIKVGCGATSPVTTQVVLHEGELKINANDGSKAFITSDLKFDPTSHILVIDVSTVIIVEGDSTKTHTSERKVGDVYFYYIGSDERILNYPPINLFVNRHLQQWVSTLPANLTCPAAFLIRSKKGDDDIDLEILFGLNCEDRFRTDHIIHIEIDNLTIYNYNTILDENKIITSFMKID